MSKVNIPITQAFRLAYPKIVCLITAADQSKEHDNIVTLAWTTPISFNPPIFGISIGPTRYTHKLIQVTKEFGVNLPTMAIVDKVLYCGRNSGKSVDKFEQTGLTPIPAKKIKASLIKECVANFECKVLDMQTYGDHSLIVGRVVAAMCDDGKYLLDKKRLDLENLDLVYHCGGDLFCSNTHKIISPK